MAYTPNTWQDRTGIGLNQFTDQTGKEYTFTPNPTSITQAGTPFSANWMNHIEQGITNVGKEMYFSTVSENQQITLANVGSYTVVSFQLGSYRGIGFISWNSTTGGKIYANLFFPSSVSSIQKSCSISWTISATGIATVALPSAATANYTNNTLSYTAWDGGANPYLTIIGIC